jgi:DNA-binding transcriptional MerR regulator
MATKTDTPEIHAPQTYTIGQMCADFSLTPRTLRFYEYKELLAPVRVGQKRLFTLRDRARLKLILRGKRFGFSLCEIKDLLDLYDTDSTGMTQMSATLEVAKHHLAELAARRDELTTAISDLEQYMFEGNRLLRERTASASTAA